MEFWSEHVDRKALLFAARVQTAAALADEGVDPLREKRRPVPASHMRKSGESDSDTYGLGALRHSRKRRKTGSGGASTSGGGQHVVLSAGLGKGASRGRGRGSGGGRGRFDNDAKTGDGRFFWTTDGKQLCWDWNRTPSGCAEPCTHSRAHVCEVCRGPHRAVQCRVA